MTERIRAVTPIDVVPLPRPLHRFGNAFPVTLAETYTSAYPSRRGVVLDPLAHPWSAADAADRCDRRGVARSPQPLGAWAREGARRAPPADDIVRAFARIAESTLSGTPHGVAMRELYASRCGTCRGPVVVEAYLWERDAPLPTKKAFRCGICAREGRSLLIEPVAAEDEDRTRALEERGLAHWQLVERFGEDAELGESVAALYTPRNLAALMSTLRAIAAWLSTHAGRAPAPFSDLDPGAADLILAQIPVEDQLGGWSHVAGALLGIGGGRGDGALEGRVSARARMLRIARQALL